MKNPKLRILLLTLAAGVLAAGCDADYDFGKTGATSHVVVNALLSPQEVRRRKISLVHRSIRSTAPRLLAPCQTRTPRLRLTDVAHRGSDIIRLRRKGHRAQLGRHRDASADGNDVTPPQFRRQSGSHTLRLEARRVPRATPTTARPRQEVPALPAVEHGGYFRYNK